MTDVYAVDSKGGKISVTLIYKPLQTNYLDGSESLMQQAVGVLLNGRSIMFDSYLDVQQFTHPESGEIYTVN